MQIERAQGADCDEPLSQATADVIDLTLDDSDEDEDEQVRSGLGLWSRNSLTGGPQPSRQSADRHASKKPRVQSPPPPAPVRKTSTGSAVFPADHVPLRAQPPEPAAVAVPVPPPRPPRSDRQRFGKLWSRAPSLPPPLPNHPVGHRFLPSGAVLPSQGPLSNPSQRDRSQPPTPGRLHPPHASTSKATDSLTPVVRPPISSPEYDWEDLERDPSYLHHLHPDDTRPSKTRDRDVYTSRAHPSTSSVRDLNEDRRPDGVTGLLVERRWTIAIPGSGDDARSSVPDAWGGAGRRAARAEGHAQEQNALGSLTIGYAQLALYAGTLADEEESE